MIGHLPRYASLALLSISFTFLRAEIKNDTTITDLTVKPLCTTNAAQFRDWQIVNPNTSPVEVSWYLIGTDQYGKLSVPPGETGFMTEAPYFQNVLFPSLMVIYWKNGSGWRRVDVTFGSGAVCGVEEVSAANSDERIAERIARGLLAMIDSLRNGAGTGTGPASGGTGATNVAEVYGNPSTGMYRLYLSVDAGQQTLIGMYNAQGTQLQSRVVSQATGYVDLNATGYLPGIYYLKVQNGGFTKTIKLIKN